MPSTRTANVPGASSVEKEILKQLAALSDNQVTKQHFDDELSGIKSTLQVHENRISSIEERLTAVENTATNSDAIYKELYDQERRKSNIVIFKLPEQDDQRNKKQLFKKEYEQVKEMLIDMELLDSINDNIKMRLFRIGKTYNKEQPRPLKVIFRNNEIKEQVFSSVKHLKGNPKWINVNICCDLTKQQQALGKAKRAELLNEAKAKNDNRSTDEIEKGVEWRVLGNYGRFNLRLQKVTPTHSPDNSEGQEEG